VTRRGRRAWTLAAGATVAAAGLAWWLASPPAADARIALRPDDRETVARGGEIYGRECASCHGGTLEGQSGWRGRRPDGRLPAPPHDETGHTWHHPDAQLFALTKVGPAALIGGGYASDMPAFEGVLSDPDIIAVLSFIKSTWPRPIRDRHDEINRRARAGE